MHFKFRTIIFGKENIAKRELHLIKLAWSRTNLPPWRREERFPENPQVL